MRRPFRYKRKYWAVTFCGGCVFTLALVSLSAGFFVETEGWTETKEQLLKGFFWNRTSTCYSCQVRASVAHYAFIFGCMYRNKSHKIQIHLLTVMSFRSCDFLLVNTRTNWLRHGHRLNLRLLFDSLRHNSNRFKCIKWRIRLSVSDGFSFSFIWMFVMLYSERIL